MNSCFFLVLIAAASTSCSSALRIIGGANSNIANHPHLASLRFNREHNCGAVLISATRGLTAAHCGGGPVGSYSVLAGTTDRTVDTCATCALRPALLDFIRHPQFANNPGVGYPNDLAVIAFYSIATNVNIQYATLATEADGDFAGESCVVAGWGRQTPAGSFATTLKEGSMTVLTSQDCQDAWGVNRINSTIHLCASDPSTAECGGDAGGPILCNGLVAGTWSWGEANCSPTFPSIFVRIGSYNEWIDSHLLIEFEDDAVPVPIL